LSIDRDYLLDTNMLGYLAEAKAGSSAPKGQQIAQTIARVQNTGRKLFISSITVGECEFGLYASPRVDRSKQDVARAVLASFPAIMVLPVDTNVAKFSYATLRAALFDKYAPKDRRGLAKKKFVGEWTDPTTQKELGVDENDVWIASIAMAYNLTLVSDDRMVKIRDAAGMQLSVENWGAP
jgi:tRNA(fMet)-specific endonuclease VapC